MLHEYSFLLWQYGTWWSKYVKRVSVEDLSLHLMLCLYTVTATCYSWPVFKLLIPLQELNTFMWPWLLFVNCFTTIQRQRNLLKRSKCPWSAWIENHHAFQYSLAGTWKEVCKRSKSKLHVHVCCNCKVLLTLYMNIHMSQNHETGWCSFPSSKPGARAFGWMCKSGKSTSYRHTKAFVDSAIYHPSKR